MRPNEKESFGGFKDTLKKKDDPSADMDDGKEAHTERNLDKGLKETFPASDPVSISPGAD